MVNDFSTEYTEATDDELLHLATERASLTTEAAVALDAELRRRNLAETDRITYQKLVKRQDWRESRSRRRKVFGKNHISWRESLSAFAIMAVILWAYFALPKTIPAEPRLAGSCGRSNDCVSCRHGWVEILVARHPVLDGANSFCRRSVGRCS